MVCLLGGGDPGAERHGRHQVGDGSEEQPAELTEPLAGDTPVGDREDEREDQQHECRGQRALAGTLHHPSRHEGDESDEEQDRGPVLADHCERLGGGGVPHHHDGECDGDRNPPYEGEELERREALVQVQFGHDGLPPSGARSTGLSRAICCAPM